MNYELPAEPDDRRPLVTSHRSLQQRTTDNEKGINGNYKEDSRREDYLQGHSLKEWQPHD